MSVIEEFLKSGQFPFRKGEHGEYVFYDGGREGGAIAFYRFALSETKKGLELCADYPLTIYRSECADVLPVLMKCNEQLPKNMCFEIDSLDGRISFRAIAQEAEGEEALRALMEEALDVMDGCAEDIMRKLLQAREEREKPEDESLISRLMDFILPSTGRAADSKEKDD